MHHARLLPGGIAGAHTSDAEPMTMSDTNVERSSGNVFADLDFPEVDLHLLKAELVVQIDDILRERGITRTETARLLGRSGARRTAGDGRSQSCNARAVSRTIVSSFRKGGRSSAERRATKPER